MKVEQFTIENILAILYGTPSEKIFLFVYGQGGNKEEAAAFTEVAVSAGFQVLGIDLPEHGERKGKPGSTVHRSPFMNRASIGFIPHSSLLSFAHENGKPFNKDEMSAYTNYESNKTCVW